MSDSEYESIPDGPDIERTHLTAGELAVLKRTEEHMPPRFQKKFRDGFDGTTKRRREAAGWVAGMAALVALAGFALNEFGNTPLPQYDIQAEADAQVLSNPTALRVLGLCAIELRAEVKLRKAEKQHQQLPNDGLTITEYEQAADLAARGAASCSPPDKTHALYETTLQGKTVDVTPAEITNYNVDDACSQLKSYFTAPGDVPIAQALQEQDITNLQSLLIATNQTCPEAGTLDVTHR